LRQRESQRYTACQLESRQLVGIRERFGQNSVVRGPKLKATSNFNLPLLCTAMAARPAAFSTHLKDLQS
jgi:hypothetical protein